MIDILLATYNSEKYLAEQIESIQRQTYPHWNLIISDDGSTDGTLDLIASFAQEDDRIHLLEHEERFGGACPNFMHLLRHSKSRYCMFCDHDDVWLERKVELTHNKMKELEVAYTPKVPLMVFTDMTVVDEDLAVLHPSFEQYSNRNPYRTSMMKLLAAPVAAGCTMMLNQPLREKVLLTPKGTPMAMHDWWICLVAAGFGHIGHVDEQTNLYRQHASNAVGTSAVNTVETLKASRTAYQSIQKKVCQGRSFYEVYGSMLDPTNEKRLRALTEVYTAPRWKRLFLMMKSHAWKDGAVRKLGEAALLPIMDMEAFPLEHA